MVSSFFALPLALALALRLPGLAFLVLVSPLVAVEPLLSDFDAADGVAGVAGVAFVASPLGGVAGVAGVAFIGSPLGAGTGALVCAVAKLAAAAKATATAVVRNLFMAAPQLVSCRVAVELTQARAQWLTQPS